MNAYTKSAIFAALVFSLIGGALAICNDCTLQLSPSVGHVCAGESATYAMKLTNIYGKTRTYTISAKGSVPLIGSFPKQITVGPYDTHTAFISFGVGSTQKPGEYQFTITASAANVSDSDDGLIVVQNCGVSMDTPKEFLTCPSAGGFTAVLTNTGDRPDNYSLKLSGTCKAALVANSIHLEPGRSKSIYIDIPSKTAAVGECDVVLTATGKYASASSRTDVRIVKCYDLSLEIEPAELVLCPCQQKNATVSVVNRGFYPQDVRLAVSGFPGDLEETLVHVGGGREVGVQLIPKGTCCLADRAPFTVTARSQYSSANAQGAVRMSRAYAGCSSIELKPAVAYKKIDCRGDAYTFYVLNTGYTRQNVRLTTFVYGDSGGLNVTLQPQEFSLGPNEAGPAALYLFPSPSAGTNKYKLLVDAQGDAAADSLSLSVIVSPGSCAVSSGGLINTSTTIAGGTPSGEFLAPAGDVLVVSPSRRSDTSQLSLDALSIALGAFTLLLALYVFAELLRLKKPVAEKKIIPRAEMKQLRDYKELLSSIRH